MILLQKTFLEMISQRQKNYKSNKLYVKLEILVLLSVCLGLESNKMPAYQLYVSLNEEATSFFPEKSLKIAKIENIFQSHFGMLYHSVNDKNFKNILYPHKTNAYSNKQGLFTSNAVQRALSSPWKDLYVQTNNCREAEKRCKKGHLQTYVRDVDDNVAVNELPDIVSLG